MDRETKEHPVNIVPAANGLFDFAMACNRKTYDAIGMDQAAKLYSLAFAFGDLTCEQALAIVQGRVKVTATEESITWEEE